MDYHEFKMRDLRLVMLKTLARSPAYRANETVLQMEAEVFGHGYSRDVIRSELAKLRELGAVTFAELGSVLVATITRRGLEHCQGKTVIEGIYQPSPES